MIHVAITMYLTTIRSWTHFTSSDWQNAVFLFKQYSPEWLNNQRHCALEKSIYCKEYSVIFSSLFFLLLFNFTVGNDVDWHQAFTMHRREKDEHWHEDSPPAWLCHAEHTSPKPWQKENLWNITCSTVITVKIFFLLRRVWPYSGEALL